MPHYTDKTCHQCEHWHPNQSNRVSVGTCRGGPPTTIAIARGVSQQPKMNPQGRVITVPQQDIELRSVYPQLPQNYPACASFSGQTEPMPAFTEATTTAPTHKRDETKATSGD